MCLNHLKNRDPQFSRVALGERSTAIIIYFLLNCIVLYWLMIYRWVRISVSIAVGLHDPHQVREQQRDPFTIAQYRQLAFPQRLQIGRSSRHSFKHFRENHPVHRSSNLKLYSIVEYFMYCESWSLESDNVS